MRRRVLKLLRGGTHGKWSKGRGMALLRREDVVDSWRRAGVAERERHARVSGALAQACYQSNLKLLMGTLVQQKLGLPSQDAFELLEASEFTNVDGASVSPNEAMLRDPDLFLGLLERHVPGLFSAPRLLSAAEKQRAFGGMRCATWRDLEHAVGSLFEQAIISLHVERAERGAYAQAAALIRELDDADAAAPAANGSARSKRRNRRRKKAKQAKQARKKAAQAGHAEKQEAAVGTDRAGALDPAADPPMAEHVGKGGHEEPDEQEEQERGPALARPQSEEPFAPDGSAGQAATSAQRPSPTDGPDVEGAEVSPAPAPEGAGSSPGARDGALGTPPRITALVDLDRRPLLLDLGRARGASPEGCAAPWASADPAVPWEAGHRWEAAERRHHCEGARCGSRPGRRDGDGGAESDDSDWSLWSDSSADCRGWGSGGSEEGEEGEEGEGGMAREMKRRMREEANRCKQQLRATYVRTAARLSYEIDGNDMPEWAPDPSVTLRQWEEQRRQARRRRRRNRRHGSATAERHALDNVLADRRSVVMRWEAAHARGRGVAAVAGWPVAWQSPHAGAVAASSAAPRGSWWDPRAGWWDPRAGDRDVGTHASAAPPGAYGAGASCPVEMHVSARGRYQPQQEGGGWVESAGPRWDRGPVPIWRSKGGAAAEEGDGAPLGPRRNLSAHAEPYVPRWAGARDAVSPQ